MEAIMSVFLKNWTHYYRKRFQDVGDNLLITGRILVLGKVSVGNYVMLESGTRLTALENGSINLGNNVYMASSTISSTKGIEIGNNVVISPQVLIVDHDGYGLDDNPVLEKSVKIGNHVWVGVRSTILKGVTVGDNSIIAAGSIVTKDVEPNTIVAGNPAKKVRDTSGFNISKNQRYPTPKHW